MLTPAMLRILRWLDEHSAALESAWDVPRSISLEGIADGIGVVRSALFQPMSTLEEDGLIQTRQAHVIGSGRRKRKVVHITQDGRKQIQQNTEEVPDRRSRTSLKLKGQVPEYTILHGRQSEIESIQEALERNAPVHLRGMPGIGKSTLARSVVQELAGQGIQVHWVQLDAYCDVHEAMQRMEVETPQILDVEGYASLFEQENMLLVFDDVHAISSRHQSSFSNLFQGLQNHNIPFMLLGRDRDTFSIEGEYVDLGPLEQADAIELLNPELGDERASIVDTLGGHPLAILLYDASTPLPETNQGVRTYVEQVVLGDASSEVHEAMSPFLVLPFPVPAEKMPDPNHVPLLDEHTLLRWGVRDSTMEMQHLIRNVCKSSLEDSEIDALHLSAIVHWEKEDDAIASILELHHRIQRGETEVSSHLSVRANELMDAYSGAFATLLDDALANESENLELIELASQHALNRAEVEVARDYIQNFDDPQLANIRLQIMQFEGKKDIMEELESMLDGVEKPEQKLRIQLSVLSRSIDDMSSNSNEEDFNRINRLIDQVNLPDKENERQVILTTIVVMRHSLAIERGDIDAANFLLDQLKGIALASDPLIQYLTTKTELKSVDARSANAALTLRNAELTASQLQQPLYKASLLLLICEQLVETQLPRAQLLHEQIDIQFIETMDVPSARRVVAKWWEVKSMFDEKNRIFALREAILRYRSVGCPNRARSLSKRMHNI
ncbi:MAG: hypothetical protein CMA41_01730 [Euryarchaeota archaeon]|nr:hypothetical protein [Euryarchaeota archaeon]|tara:strand:- start:3337 stop:5520 length:2184 start_codon:yes stop_codon:yes gene_type:complete